MVLLGERGGWDGLVAAPLKSRGKGKAKREEKEEGAKAEPKAGVDEVKGESAEQSRQAKVGQASRQPTRRKRKGKGGDEGGDEEKGLVKEEAEPARRSKRSRR